MNSERNIVIIGAGGSGREFADQLSYDMKWNVVGFLDEKIKKGTIIDGLPVLGGDSWFSGYAGNAALCLVGQPEIKPDIIEKIKSYSAYVQFPIIINSRSHVSKYATLGEGCVVAHPFNTICPGVHIGKHVWINERTGIGHDSRIDDYTTVYSGINIGGGTKIGAFCVIGSGVTIRPGVTIGNHVVIGGGTMVTKNVPDGVTVIGNPMRILEKK